MQHDEFFQRQIAVTDRQSDVLVYELYELTKREIGVCRQFDAVRFATGAMKKLHEALTTTRE